MPNKQVKKVDFTSVPRSLKLTLNLLFLGIGFTRNVKQIRGYNRNNKY